MHKPVNLVPGDTVIVVDIKATSNTETLQRWLTTKAPLKVIEQDDDMLYVMDAAGNRDSLYRRRFVKIAPSTKRE